MPFNSIPEFTSKDRTRLLSQFEVGDPDECWDWHGTARNERWNRYGYFAVDGRQYMAHRAVYAILIGQPDPTLTLDHLCKNHRCVNPAHLDPVTRAVNLGRSNAVSAVNSRKTHCKRGHEFTPENTAISKQGERSCRMCARQNQHNYVLMHRERADETWSDENRTAAMLARPNGWICPHGHVFSETVGRVVKIAHGFSRICTICEYDKQVRYKRKQPPKPKVVREPRPLATTCRKGHPRNEHNSVVRQGKIVCLICSRANGRAYKARKRLARQNS